jgi:hypothetical protein
VSGRAGLWARLVPPWPLIVALLAFARALAQPGAVLHDPDTYLHIAAGRWMVTRWALPTHDPFSYTFAGGHWAAPEWLAEIVLAAVFRASGWGGLALAAIGCFAASLALLTRFLLRSCEPFTALIAVALGAVMVEPHLLARPHILALPLLVLWSGALFAARDTGEAPPFRLLPAMVLWANLHASFLFGLGLAVFLGAEAVLLGTRATEARRWGRFVALAFAAALLTPNGIAGLVEPFRLIAMPALQSSIIEWRGPDFQQFQPLEVWLLGLTALGLTTGIRLPLSRVLLLLALCSMALAHARHADLLGLVGPLVMAGSLGPQLAARIRTEPPSPLCRAAARLAEPAAPPAIALALGMMLAISLPRLAHPIIRADDPATPSSALAAATRLRIAGHVFNAEGFGGYLVYRGVPTFIDGRIELYGDAFLARYVAAAGGDADALGDLLDHWDVRWTLLAPDQPAVGLLDHLPGWRRIYAEARAVIHVRTGEVRGTAPR